MVQRIGFGGNTIEFPDEFSQEQIDQIIKQRAPEYRKMFGIPEPEAPSYASDLYQFAKKGAGSGISGLGWLGEKTTGYGSSLQEYGGEMAKAAEAEISPLAKERASRNYLEEAAPGEGMFGYKPNFAALAGAPYQIAESLPGSLAGMGAAAAATAIAPVGLIGATGTAGIAALRVLGPLGAKLATSALGRAGTAAAVATGKDVFEAAAPAVGKMITATLAGSTTEGLQAAGMSGEEIEKIITQHLTADPSALNRDPIGKAALAQANGNVEEAIKIAAAESAGKAALKTGLATAALSLPGSIFEAGIITGAAKRGAIRQAITGGLTEGLAQEMPQSAAEQYIQNVAQGAYDPSVTPGQGVLESAIKGGIAGFGMGAGLGGVSSAVQGAEPSVEEVDRMGRRVGQEELGLALEDVRRQDIDHVDMLKAQGVEDDQIIASYPHLADELANRRAAETAAQQERDADEAAIRDAISEGAPAYGDYSARNAGVPVDENIPAQENTTVVDQLPADEAFIPDFAPEVAPDIASDFSPEVAPEIAPEIAPEAAVETDEDLSVRTASPSLPKTLAGAKPKYGFKSNNFQLNFESDLGKALYIAEGKNPDNAYRKWLINKAGIPEENIDTLGQQIKSQIRTVSGSQPAGVPISVTNSFFGEPSANAPQAAAPATQLEIGQEAPIDEAAFEEELSPTTAPEDAAGAALEPLDPARLMRSHEIVGKFLNEIAARGPSGKTQAQVAAKQIADGTLSSPEVHHALIANDIVSRILGGTQADPDTGFFKDLTGLRKEDAVRKRAGTAGGGLRGLIEFSLNPGSLSYMRETAYHEPFHILQDLMQQYDPKTAKLVAGKFGDGMTLDQIDPSIRRTLQMAAPEKGGPTYWDNFSEQYQAATPAGEKLRSEFGKAREAQAYMFGMLADAKAQGYNTNALSAPMKRFLNFLAQVRQRMGNYLRGQGYRSVQDVFHDYASGKGQQGYGAEVPVSGATPDGEEYSFVGKGAKNWPQDLQDKAEALEEEGADAEQVWMETGMHRGLRDHKWRYEVPDVYAKFDPDGLKLLAGRQTVDLKDLLLHPEFFSNYPSFMASKISARNDVRPGEAGFYRHRGINYIELSLEDAKALNSGVNNDMMQSLLHEIQHGIQESEGFAKGVDTKASTIKIVAERVEQAARDTLDDPRHLAAKTVRQIAAKRVGKTDYETTMDDWRDEVKNAFDGIEKKYGVTLIEDGFFAPSRNIVRLGAIPSNATKEMEKNGIGFYARQTPSEENGWKHFRPITKDEKDAIMAELLSDPDLKAASEIFGAFRAMQKDLDAKIAAWKKEYSKEQKSLAVTMKKLGQPASAPTYRGEPGERESRDTELRSKLTSAEERRAQLPGALMPYKGFKAEGSLDDIINKPGYAKAALAKMNEAIKKSVPEPEEFSQRGGANAPAGDNPFPRPPAADVDGRLRRTRKRRAEYKAGVSNGPKNERLELDDERKGMENKGKTSWMIGQITPEDWITRVEANLTPQEIEEAAQWYAQAMKAYSQYFGKDWPKYLAAWLMANQQASPASAQMNAIRAREKVLSGAISGPKAGLAEARLLPFWNALEKGGELPLGGAQKLYDFIDSGLLRETRSWMHDNPEAGAPAVADVHSLRDAGFVDATLHKILVKKYGDQAKDIPIDIGGSPSEAQYEKAADFLREVTDYLNETNYLNHKWTAAEVQAVGWMSTSKFTGNQGQTPFEAIVRNIRDLNYELGFGEGAPYNDQFPDLARLPTIGQKEVIRDVLGHVTDFVVKTTGLKEIGRVQATGGWLSDNVEQNMRLQTVASPEAMVDGANMIGWITQQTGMLPYRLLPLKAKGGGEKFALRISPSSEGNPLASDEMMGSLWQKLRKANLKKSGAKDAPAIIQGYSTHEANGKAAMLIMFDGGGDRLRSRILEGDINDVLKKISGEMGIDLDLELMRHESDYRQNNWKEDKDGEGYLQGLRKRYGPDIQKRLRDYQRSEFEPRLGRAIEAAKAKYGLKPATKADEGKLQDERSVRGGSGVLDAASWPIDAPLESLPTQVDVPGLGKIKVGPSVRIRRLAREYMFREGMPYNPPTKYVRVDKERAERIAQAYDEMENNPLDPKVKAAYAKLAEETMAQWEIMKRDGFKAEFYPDGFDPYPASPRLAIEDILQNNHLYVYPTETGYGEVGITDKDRRENPMLQETGEIWNGKPVLINDIFRAVHDYFGHAKEGVGFRADGEENAWRAHSAMYSPLARLALTSETRGQNSWLNYGMYGDKNRNAKLEDTVFADQKLGILPDWVAYEGAEDFLEPISAKSLDERSQRGGVEEGEKAIGRAIQNAGANAVTTGGKIKRFLKSTFDPLAELPEREQYLLMRYSLLGKTDALEDEAKGFYEIIKKATDLQKKQIYAYLTTRGAVAPVLPPELRATVLQVKTRINQIGNELLGRRIISPQSLAVYKDKYLPRLYMKYLLEERGIADTGIRVGNQQYKLQRNQKLGVEDRIAMGEVVDPGFLSFAALYRPARDMAVLDFLSKVANSSGTDWVMPDQLINWKGTKVTAFWMSDEAKNIRERMLYEPDARKKAVMERVANQMQALSDPLLNQLTPENYKRLPTSSRYGALKGLAVRKEIYDDLIATGGFDPDPNFIDKIFGDKNSSLARGTQFWKMTKTILNPPTQVRNFISNAAFLGLSGVPLHMVPKRMMQAFDAMRNNGLAWQVAKQYGVRAGGFNENELRDAQQVLREYLSQNTTGLMNPRHITNFLASLTDKAGNAYQLTEMLFKTAKIVDEIERKGIARMPAGAARTKAEGLAALEAHKWFFDYSLVPRGIKSLRTMPFGAPFITYYYKALPLIIEVATNPKTAMRFAPYIALQAALPILVASMEDVDEDDVDKLKMAMSEQLREKPSMLIIPFRDQLNRWQFLDAGYFFPWSMFLNTALSVSKGDVSGALGSVGALSSPALSAAAAIKTNIDPFTGREIINPLDTPKEQMYSLLHYVNGLISPPILTQYGALGKAIDAATNTGMNKYGEPNMTATQIALRAFGINVTPLVPEMQRDRNLNHMESEYQRVESLRTLRLKDASLTDKEAEEISNDFDEKLKGLWEKMQKYAEESDFPTKLQTNK